MLGMTPKFPPSEVYSGMSVIGLLLLVSLGASLATVSGMVFRTWKEGRKDRYRAEIWVHCPTCQQDTYVGNDDRARELYRQLEDCPKCGSALGKALGTDRRERKRRPSKVYVLFAKEDSVHIPRADRIPRGSRGHSATPPDVEASQAETKRIWWLDPDVRRPLGDDQSDPVR